MTPGVRLKSAIVAMAADYTLAFTLVFTLVTGGALALPVAKWVRSMVVGDTTN